MKEEWKDVQKFGRYKISNYGRVYDKARKRYKVISTKADGAALFSVDEYGKPKPIYLGRMMFSVFNGKDYWDKSWIIGRKDSDASNNDLNNLFAYTPRDRSRRYMDVTVSTGDIKRLISVDKYANIAKAGTDLGYLGWTAYNMKRKYSISGNKLIRHKR